jgi:hypothetical protein
VEGFPSMHIKFRAFWDTAACSLTEADLPFKGAYCLHHHSPDNNNNDDDDDDDGNMYL